MTTNIQKWGNSQGIRIPRHILEAAKLKSDDKVQLLLTDEGIMIKKVQNSGKTIRELFSDYHGSHNDSEVDWGKNVGDEAW